jgi:hypothetical protein
MRSLGLSAIGALMGATLMLASVTGPAAAYNSAPLNFCNKTAAEDAVAIGYYSPGLNDPADHSVLTGPFVSHGWWHVDPGACRITENPFNARYMFWFVLGPMVPNRDYSDALAMRDPSLQDHFCISTYFNRGGHGVAEFTYEAENASVEACDRAGGPADSGGVLNTLWIHPLKVDTWVSPTVNYMGG